MRLVEVLVEYRTPGGAVTAVSDVSLDVPPSGLTVLAGPSGPGKPTLRRGLGPGERRGAGAAVWRDGPAGARPGGAGPAGAGKSTLLRVLSLVERPTLGNVELRGMGTARLSDKARRAVRRTDVALVFQNP